jgi:hypothetical protein
MFKNSGSAGPLRQPYSFSNKSLKIRAWSHEQTLAIVKNGDFAIILSRWQNCKKILMSGSAPYCNSFQDKNLRLRAFEKGYRTCWSDFQNIGVILGLPEKYLV